MTELNSQSNPAENESIYYPTIAEIVGKTPLIRLQRIPGPGNQIRNNIILGKLEGNNPAGSVKDRPALSMIKKAQEPCMKTHTKRRALIGTR